LPASPTSHAAGPAVSGHGTGSSQCYLLWPWSAPALKPGGFCSSLKPAA
jgi:hypothetical protein